jgi:hypothetical protein
MSEPLRIERDELFTDAVDSALARERAGRERAGVRILADAPPVSPLRRLLLHSMFYLPVAAVLGALAAWLVIEPSMTDYPVVGGEVTLINAEPFDAPAGFLALSLGDHDVLVHPDKVRFEPGDQGQPALRSVAEIRIGDKLEAAGEGDGTRLVAGALRPSSDASPRSDYGTAWAGFALFPLTALAIALGLLLSEGLSTRNWRRMIARSVVGSFFAVLFSVLAFLPAGWFMNLGGAVLAWQLEAADDRLFVSVADLRPLGFLLFTACRSAAWAAVGAGLGVGMNLVRSTRAQLRNSVIGGALGGALGGMFFDPIDRFFRDSMFDGAELSRAVGLLAVGLSIGVFVALVERLGRDAWLRVRTGPLAGKSFVLYKTPTSIGNDPASDIYLYKDAGIDPSHAAIHRVGVAYELEDQGSRTGTSVGGALIRRRRLVSGDQIILGSTVLEFEERQRTVSAA